MIFTKVYDFIPGKSIRKGLYYGLIVISISNFQMGTYLIGWGLIWTGLWNLFVGFFHAIVYGSLLGYLYKK